MFFFFFGMRCTERAGVYARVIVIPFAWQSSNRQVNRREQLRVSSRCYLSEHDRSLQTIGGYHFAINRFLQLMICKRAVVTRVLSVQACTFAQFTHPREKSGWNGNSKLLSYLRKRWVFLWYLDLTLRKYNLPQNFSELTRGDTRISGLWDISNKALLIINSRYEEQNIYFIAVKHRNTCFRSE